MVLGLPPNYIDNNDDDFCPSDIDWDLERAMESRGSPLGCLNCGLITEQQICSKPCEIEFIRHLEQEVGQQLM